MPRFNVTLTRTATENADVRVDADTAAEANAKALALARRSPTQFDWELDLDNFHEPYLGDPSSAHEVTPQVQPFTIPAEVHSDDFVREVNFDALDWFKQATDAQIMDLAASEWGVDYEADGVAQYMGGWVPEITSLFHYLDTVNEGRGSDGFGFECHIEEQPAMKWLEANKPGLAAQIKETKTHA